MKEQGLGNQMVSGAVAICPRLQGKKGHRHLGSVTYKTFTEGRPMCVFIAGK